LANIFDVAREAEVSVATVSRVLNNDPTVRPSTRRVVEMAMAELGYLPNAGARALRQSRSKMIGLVLPSLSNPTYEQIIGGIEDTARENGYSLLLCDSRWNPQIQSANVRTLFERRVEGLVIFPTGDSCPELDLYARANLPVVIVYSAESPFTLPTLYLNHRAGLKAAIEYLAGLGHQRIAIVTPQLLPYRARADDYREILADLGLPYDPSLVVFATVHTTDSGQAEALFARSDRPTAIISATARLAPSVLFSIRRAGLSIPRDISFITMGDSPWAEAYNPPLTAVPYDRLRLGREVAEYIFARLAGEEAEALLTEIKSELLIRESCMPPIG
jgi:LacI family transcriptional regulator